MDIDCSGSHNNINPEDLPVSLQPFVEVIGLDHTLMLCRELGGEAFYIPKWKAPLIAERNEKIIQEYNEGSTARYLARRYSLTERRIFQIVKGSFLRETAGAISQ